MPLLDIDRACAQHLARSGMPIGIGPHDTAVHESPGVGEPDVPVT